jgi:AcrR family transcriptional regulator
MQSNSTTRVDSDSRQAAILRAAFDAFTRYGFRRTSMADIASGVGISRAALYLHYRNKEDIYRSLAQEYYARAERDVVAALGQSGDAGGVLAAAFAAQGGPVFEVMLNSPHGAELMDTKFATSADIAEAGEARIVVRYSEWLGREDEAGRISLEGLGTPEALAAVMMGALHGLKAGAVDYDGYCGSVAQLALMFGRALRV